MSVSLRADSGGATGALALNGSDKLLLNADGTLSATANPATGLRSQALATMQKFTDEFGVLLASNGWQKLPSGLIMQWGSVTLGAGITAVTFPIAFTAAAYSIVCSSINATIYADAVEISSLSTTSFSAVIVSSGAGGASAATAGTIFWQAIGK